MRFTGAVAACLLIAGADGVTTGAGQHEGFADVFPPAVCFADPQWLHMGALAGVAGAVRHAMLAFPLHALITQ